MPETTAAHAGPTAGFTIISFTEGPDVASGRGLLLVAAYSNAWGCRPGTDGVGKTTWARLGSKPSDA